MSALVSPNLFRDVEVSLAESCNDFDVSGDGKFAVMGG